MSNWNRYYFRPSPPRKAKGGVKSRSKRGSFGESWWAQRWIETLEGFDIDSRLTRGRSYARSGQVLSVNIEKGLVTAEVQGSSPRPYKVEINVQMLSEAQWKKLIKALNKQVIFVAQLLDGQMPEEIEEVFAQTKVPLFPEQYGQIETDCSCPDWSNPCKHIAAVYYLLAEEFDRDPFLIFRLRGLDRDELMERLSQGGAAVTTKREEPAPLPPEPLPNEPEAFWGGGEFTIEYHEELRTPPVSAALPRALGGFPFWRADQAMPDALYPVYEAASKHALEQAIGEEEDVQGEG